jgi:hypothetical protein
LRELPSIERSLAERDGRRNNEEQDQHTDSSSLYLITAGNGKIAA